LRSTSKSDALAPATTPKERLAKRHAAFKEFMYFIIVSLIVISEVLWLMIESPASDVASV
jgi:hypothetical protein